MCRIFLQKSNDRDSGYQHLSQGAQRAPSHGRKYSLSSLSDEYSFHFEHCDYAKILDTFSNFTVFRDEVVSKQTNRHAVLSTSGWGHVL